MSIDDQEPDGTGVIRDAWDQFHDTGETARAFTAFLAYRNLPPATRSARRVVPLVYGPEYTDDHPLFNSKWEQCQTWSMRHQWPARASAWDQYQADEQAVWDIEQIRDMRTRHADLAKAALTKVTDLIEEHKSKWEVKDIIRLFDVATRVERGARGDTDRLNLRLTGQDGGPVQINTGTDEGPDMENLIRIAAILEEAGVMPEGTANAVAVSLGTGTDTPPH